MRILFVLKTISIAGGIRTVLDFTRRLRRAGHDARVACLEPVSREEMRRWIPWIDEAPVHGWSSDLARSAEALIGTEVVATWHLVARDSGPAQRFAWLQNDERVFHTDPDVRSRVEAAYRLPISKLANSRWLQCLLSDEFGQHSELLYPGIDLDEWAPVETGNRSGGGVRVLLEGASASPMKGIAEAVEAIRRIPNLWVRHADAAPAVYHVDPVNHSPAEGPAVKHPWERCVRVGAEVMRYLYSWANVLVKPQRFEGLPQTQLECMAVGQAAVLCADSGGSRDLIIDQHNGRLFRAGDAADLEAKLRELIAEEATRRRLAQNARNHVSEHFPWDRAVARIEAFLTERHP